MKKTIEKTLVILLIIMLCASILLSANLIKISPVSARALTASTLLSDLEYPKGLWVKGDQVYLTETAGRNTVYGGNVRLDRYNVTSGMSTVLVEDPTCSDAVVVAPDNKIYLTSYVGSTPGESGMVSVVDPTTMIETHLVDIAIASEDMFIDPNNNILIIGMSDQSTAKSIYLLPSGYYTNPVVLKTGLGRCWSITEIGDDTYFSVGMSGSYSINFFRNFGGNIETFLTGSHPFNSMSFGSGYLYYADFEGGIVGRIDIQTKTEETLLSGLNNPACVRYDQSSGRLYFLEGGTDSGQYKDGTLKYIDMRALTIVNTVDVPPDSNWNYLITELPFNNTVANFTLPAEGGSISFPSLGVTGGDYLVTEITKYYYDTTVDVNGTVFEESEAFVHLDAGDVVSVTFTNTAAPFTEPGYTFASVDAAPPIDLTFPFPANKFIPVQSAWPIDKNTVADGKLDLVVNKTMAILVNVTDAAIEQSTQVTVNVEFDNFLYTDVTPTGSAQKRLIAIYPIIPTKLGEFNITGNYTIDTVTTQLTSTTVTVRDTVILKLYFAYFTPPTSNPTAYSTVTPESFSQAAKNITAFINATYPVKQVIANTDYKTLSSNVSSGGTQYTGAKNDAKYIALKAKTSYGGDTSAIGIAIVPDNYFTYHKFPAGVAGVSWGQGVKGVLVAESWFTAGAHEVSHAFCSNFYPKEYYNTTGLKGTTVSGVWAEKGQWRTGYDIMDLAGPIDGTWINDKATYKYLFKNATKTIADPEILVVSGDIYKNGTVKLDEWFHVEQGTPDLILPGNYSLKFLDEDGTVLSTVSFDAEFFVQIDPGVSPGQNEIDLNAFGGVEINSAPFVFATEYPEGTASVQVVNNTDPANPVTMATVYAESITYIEPELSMTAYFTDTNFEPMNSFDVLFKPTSSKVTTLTLTATNPATYYYTLDFKNNGPALSSLPITVKIPADFVLAGAQPVQIDFVPVSYTFTGGVLTVNVPNVASGQMFTLRVHLDYKLKGTKPYPADSPTTYLKTYTFESAVNGVSTNAPTITAAGKKATAIGGFVTDTNGSPKGGLQVKLYKGNKEWTAIVDGDGFYFAEVDSGGPYLILVFNSNNVLAGIQLVLNVAKNTYVSADVKVLPTDCAIQGFVKDNHNNPVAGVTVKLLNSAGKVVATTRTNLGGYYVFRFYLPGTYTVKIEVPPGYNAIQNSQTLRIRLFETATANFALIKT